MPRLSEVAHHLVIPSGIKTDGWPAVEKKLERMGVVFDSWQVGAARLILGKREDETYAATIGGIFLSIPRQVGKTYMISSLVFALCLLTPNLTVVWTAHLLKTAGQTLRVWRGMSKRKYVRPFVTQIRVGSGDWKVIFANGSTITLSAREGDQGRGESEVDLVIFDEAQILSDRGVDALVPTANASKQKSGALVIYMGTPPKPTDDSEVFTRNRTAALSGTADDMLYIEFSADPKTDPKEWPAGHVDFDAVASANPSYPVHTPKVSILRMARQLSRESLRREGLGIWDETTAGGLALSLTRWRERSQPKPDGVPAYGVKFSKDGKRAAIAVGVPDGLGGAWVEVVEYGELDALEVAAWLADKPPNATQARSKSMARLVVDGYPGTPVLLEALQRARVPGKKITAPTVAQVTAAHQSTFDAVTNGTISHSDQPGLNKAVGSAGKRLIGNRGGWGWEQVGEADILPLDAATLAYWAATSNVRRQSTGTGPRRLN